MTSSNFIKRLLIENCPLEYNTKSVYLYGINSILSVVDNYFITNGERFTIKTVDEYTIETLKEIMNDFIYRRTVSIANRASLITNCYKWLECICDNHGIPKQIEKAHMFDSRINFLKALHPYDEKGISKTELGECCNISMRTLQTYIKDLDINESKTEPFNI